MNKDAMVAAVGAGSATDRLGMVWPQVSSRLHTMLRARRVQHCHAEDIVQEVALRVIDKGVHYADADDLYRWAATVARNLHVSFTRDQAKRCSAEHLEAVPATVDVVDQVHWRRAFGAATRAIADMSEGDRTVLLQTLADTPVQGPEPSRVSVRRHRARQRLRQALSGLLGVIAPGLTGWRFTRRQFGVGTIGVGFTTAALVMCILQLPSFVPSHAEASPAAPVIDIREALPPRELPQQPVSAAVPSIRGALPVPSPRSSGTPSEPRAHVDTPAGVGVHMDKQHHDEQRPLLCVGGGPVTPICTPIAPTGVETTGLPPSL